MPGILQDSLKRIVAKKAYAPPLAITSGVFRFLCKGQDRMLIEFDQNTLANMTAALESVCKKLPSHEDNHDNRKRIADGMIESARTGKRSYSDLKDAGDVALKKIIRPKRFSWLQVKRLLISRQ
jgi:hypothetical protein